MKKKRSVAKRFDGNRQPDTPQEGDMTEYQERKAGLSHQWIKSKESGRSYLCPVGSVENIDSASEEELRSKCVDESENPQND